MSLDSSQRAELLHIFSQVLWPWADQDCRACRNFSLFEREAEELKCQSCDNTENLWLCLICGNIGCGRYQSRHAVTHFDVTQHTFTIELNSQRIWNYRGDFYVHRLIRTDIGRNPIDNHFYQDNSLTDSSGLKLFEKVFELSDSNSPRQGGSNAEKMLNFNSSSASDKSMGKFG